MSFAGAIGPVVKNAPDMGVAAVKCFYCDHLQTKYIGKTMNYRRKCQKCGAKRPPWYVGYRI